MRPVRIALLFILIPFLAFPQHAKKSMESVKINSDEIVIDGNLNDSAWQKASIAKDFVMYLPGNGAPEPENQRSEVRILYSNDAIYVGAMLYDSAPDSILTQLTARDNYSQNNDWFGVFINPYNDGLSDFNFWVTAAGVQADSRTTSNGDDFGWNTVWKSAISITGEGWICEMEIPYMSLRFPETPETNWGLNMIRSIRRSRSEYSWSFLDRNSGFPLEYQTGLLKGVKDIDPPIRLSFNPYLSTYADNYQGKSSYEINAGLDLKYGINEAFTLDMTLIPDFGQVPFDEQILNLSPFENRFQENRGFFTEGTDLFNKGGIFYSRRIGGTPKNITGIDLTDNDSVDIRQEYTQLLNATKISGQTKNNLGIGFLNAVTDNNYATIVDAQGSETQSLVEPWTNYNVFVLDKRLNRKSSVSFINTNVMRNGASPDANVSALLGTYVDKSGTYQGDIALKTSNLFNNKQVNTGYQGELSIKDVKGNWTWNLGENIITDTYNINDLGFQTRNNRIVHSAGGSYRNITPSGPFNRYEFSLSSDYSFLYKPQLYERLGVNGSVFFLLRSFFAFGVNGGTRPVDEYNYFESRTENRGWRIPSSYNVGGFISSDYRKTFALDLRISYGRTEEFNTEDYSITIEPRVRVNDNFFVVIVSTLSQSVNNLGFASSDTNINTIYFGQRNIDRIQNTIRADYVFNPKTSLRLNLRHLWTGVKYNRYFTLDSKGELDHDFLFEGINNINFNTLNIDLRFSWWFAPGSEMVILYRNAIATSGERIETDYFENVNNLLNSPQQNNLSLRLTYFLDYNTIRKQFRK